MTAHPDSPVKCPVCAKEMTARLESWLFYCHACGFWASLLGSGDHRLKEESTVIEERRLAGLIPVREHNNGIILDLLERFTPVRGSRILDVGCSYGWFLRAAAERGAVVMGIEPEESVAAEAVKAGGNVRVGYFPHCMDPAERFDVIVFNDVLEHLPEVERIIRCCHAHGSEQGKLAINIPVSNGIIFRCARLLAGFGCRSPFFRLWQKDYRSPHLSYFNGENLVALAAKNGFRLLHRQRLRTVVLKGLWARLNMDRSKPSLVAAATFAAILFAYPFLTWCAPPDLMLYLFERIGNSSKLRFKRV